MTNANDTVTLAVSCSRCGGSHMSLADPRRDDSPVACGSCGFELGAWAEVKEQARAAMFDAMRDDFRDMLHAALAHSPYASFASSAYA